MFMEATAGQMDEILTFSWRAQTNLETASYPLYPRKRALQTAMEKCLRNGQDRLLACYDQGRLIAAIILMVEAKNRYLQAVGIYMEVEPLRIYRELLQWLAASYRGFALFFGYPQENAAAIQAMAEIGAERVDSCVSLRLAPRAFSAYPATADIKELDAPLWDAFAAFHDAHNPDIYWTSARIKESPERWKIFVMSKGPQITGSILYAIWNAKEADIYAITLRAEIRAMEAAASLLSQTIPIVFSLGKQSILYMADECMEQAMEAALKVGFRKTGHYLGFRVTV